MGDAKKRLGTEKYRERDLGIVLGLRSSNDAKREAAMAVVEKTLRWPLALVLRGIAQRSTSSAFEVILDEKMRVDEEKYKPIWQETMKCLYENVKKKEFELRENLLGYLTKIALRLIEKQHPIELGHNQSAELEKIEAKSSNDLEESENRDKLLMEIDRFSDSLNENDRMALQIGMRLMTSNDFNPISKKVLAHKIRNANVWAGSDASILRRYSRLREKLRAFLKYRGYDV